MPGANILIYRTGSLGDTLVALPALWVVRKHFAGARLSLLHDRQARGLFVSAEDVLRGSNLIDNFITYTVDFSAWGRFLSPLRKIVLLKRLRAEHFDTLVYLAPRLGMPRSVQRDRLFFRAAGIRTFIGMEGSWELPTRRPGEPLPAMPHVADQMLARLAESGIPVPAAGHGRIGLNLCADDERQAAIWLQAQYGGPRQGFIAVAPGSNRSVNIWPRERFEAVVRQLIGRFDIWPIIFGGAKDREVGDQLVKAWGRGYVAAGPLSVRSAAAVLKQCLLYVGNDTGTMHLAAAMGVPCVAIFSARNPPGKWEPYGQQHKVFRVRIDCEGCMLDTCIERGMECILSIDIDEVQAACATVLTRSDVVQRLMPSTTDVT